MDCLFSLVLFYLKTSKNLYKGKLHCSLHTFQLKHAFSVYLVFFRGCTMLCNMEEGCSLWTLIHDSFDIWLITIMESLYLMMIKLFIRHNTKGPTQKTRRSWVTIKRIFSWRTSKPSNSYCVPTSSSLIIERSKLLDRFYLINDSF